MFNDELLNHLVGNWELCGRMGNTQLHHRVVAEWVLGHQFLRIHTQEWNVTRDGANYESLYFIGWSKPKNSYVFHLIDTFGGGFSETLGHGVQTGNSLVFQFAYDKGPFENSFAWDNGNKTWDMTLRFKDESGKWQVFATKKLTRVGA